MKINQADGLPSPAAHVEGSAPPTQTVSPAPASLPMEPTHAQLTHAVASANRQMSAVAPSLEFEFDPDTHNVVIRLVDRLDQRVLRQVPSPEMLAIARALDRMQTLLVRTRA